MSKRYRDIRRGNQLKNALDKYTSYLQTLGDTPPNLNSKGPIGPRVNIEIEPFGLKEGEGPNRVLVRAGAADLQVLAVLFTPDTDAKIVNPASANAVRFDGFRPARVVTFMNPTRVVSIATSKITNNQYLKYQGKSRNCPFGRNADTDELFTSFGKIVTRFHTQFANQQVRRISLQVEKVAF